jgi:transcriptional regulator with XRE-family HTH domain
LTLIGEHIRTARQLLGWSQLVLALRAGVGINQLRNFEIGVTAPRSATIAALQRSLEAAGVHFIAMNGGGGAVRLLITHKAPGKTISTGRALAKAPDQDAILEALPARDGDPIPTSAVFERLGIQQPTNVQRASMSRSLARLAERGFAQRWTPDAFRPGMGYLWSRA